MPLATLRWGNINKRISNMANYIHNSLEEGESIVLNGRLHWTSIASYLVTAWVLAIVAVVMVIWGLVADKSVLLWVGGVALVVALVTYLVGRIVRTRSEFAVTNNRFIQKDGILNIQMTEIPLFKIETVNFYQTFWQRMLNTGCIELVGSGGTSHKIHAIEHPMEVRKTIVGAINRQKQDNE